MNYFSGSTYIDGFTFFSVFIYFYFFLIRFQKFAYRYTNLLIYWLCLCYTNPDSDCHGKSVDFVFISHVYVFTIAESSSSFRGPWFCRVMNRVDELILSIPDDAACKLWGVCDNQYFTRSPKMCI
ncbi:hypothetical protein Hanom_Chr12g01119891 [Helianthus anomalus]